MPLPWQTPFSRSIVDPRSLPNLALWLDSKDVSSLRNDAGNQPVNSDGIKLAGDKSGNSSTNVLCLNGVAGNYASVPDPVEIGTLTALELIGAGRLPDWTPAAASTLVGKFDASGQLSFLLRITATNIFLEISNNGTATTAVSAGAANTLVDYSLGAIKATWRASDGRVQFFQSATWTSAASPGTWTQVGTDQTIAYASIFNSTSRLTIGAFDPTGSSSPLTGNLHYVSVADAIDGAPVISVNFTGFSKLSNGTASTGATVTINTSGATGARISGARDLYQGTAANQPILTIAAGGNYLTFDGSNDYLKAAAFALSQPETVYFVGSQVTWTLNDYLMDGNAGDRLGIWQRAASPRLSMSAGANGGTTAVGTPALGANSVVTAVFNGASSSIRDNRVAAVTGDASTGAANGFVLGCYGGIAQYANITAQEVLVFAAAHDKATQDRVILYLSRKWGIAA